MVNVTFISTVINGLNYHKIIICDSGGDLDIRQRSGIRIKDEYAAIRNRKKD